ncbi:MAG: fatty acid desaturase [Pseudomonadota bacterium]
MPSTPQPVTLSSARPTRTSARLEWPTLGLIAIMYGAWLSVVIHWRSLGPWLGTPLLIVLNAWYMSLQHELIHGHPTPWARLNASFGQLPLAVWYPYAIYRDSHLAHHHDATLTLPGIDPETYYVARDTLRQAGPLRLRLRRWRNTAPGRLLLGPALGWGHTVLVSWRMGPPRFALVWGWHLLLLGALLAMVQRAGIAPLYYLLAIAYPALSLTMVRSLFEHRAAPHAHARSVLNEAAWPWRLLFLNLNYHLVHHLHPGLPWFRLRTAYLARRAHYHTRADGFIEHGYLPLLWRYRSTPVIADVHPFA